MIVRTYKELEFFLEMFKNGNSELLIIESRGGLGKSRLTEEVLQEISSIKIVSHITPLQLYILGYKFKNLPLIIDDCDGLLYNDQNISLLKMFCETRETKRVSWLSTSGILKEQGAPLSYETKSKVLILTNDFQKLTKNLGALSDRGWHILFEPTDEEILNRIKEIKGFCSFDLSIEEVDEVYGLIEQYSSFGKFSLRTFVKGLALYKQCKNNETNWKEILLQEMKINPKLILIGSCFNSYNNDKDRIELWESKGFSRRSFYDYKAKFVQKCSNIPKTLAQLHN